MRRWIILFLLALAPAVFPLSLSVENNGFISFGNLAPGEGEYITFGNAYPETIVSFSVNAGTALNFSIRADDFLGPTSMPISALRFKVAYAERISPVQEAVTNTFLIPNQIPIQNVGYDTGWSNFISSSTPFLLFSDPTPATSSYGAKFIWGLRVPSNQQAGTYYSNIWFTLTGN